MLVVCTLSWFRHNLSVPSFLKVCWILSRDCFYLDLLSWSLDFCLWFILHLRFALVEPSWCFKNKTTLIVICDIFNMLYNLVCTYLVRIFVYVHQRYWFADLSFGCAHTQFEYQGKNGFTEWIQKHPRPLYFMDQLKEEHHLFSKYL